MKNKTFFKRILSFVLAGVTTVTVSGCSKKQQNDVNSSENIVIEEVITNSTDDTRDVITEILEGEISDNKEVEEEAKYDADDLKIIEIFDPIEKQYKRWIVADSKIDVLGELSNVEREYFDFFEGNIESFKGSVFYKNYVSILDENDYFHIKMAVFSGVLDGTDICGGSTFKVFIDTNDTGKDNYAISCDDVFSKDKVYYLDYLETSIVNGEVYVNTSPSYNFNSYNFTSFFENRNYSQSELEEILVGFDVKSSLKTDDDIEKTLTLQK